MKIQHLVLDDDVHKALKARKRTTGVTVKEIGNSALRAALSIPTMDELIVEKLVESGKISRQEYDQAVVRATKDLRVGYKRALEVARRDSENKTWVLGSWEGTELYRSSDGELQIGELRARDGNKAPTPVLVFDESHFWITVLAGRVRVQMNGEDRAWGPQEMIYIPPGTPHATAPLTRNTRALLTVTPPVTMDSDRPMGSRKGKAEQRVGS